MNRLFSLFLFCFLCISSSAFTAAQLFHAIIAEKWCNTFENYTEEEKREFFLGTIFPDIRYLGNISRESTHEYGLTIRQIRDISSPFVKGMRVHALVDEVRAITAKGSSFIRSLGPVYNVHSLFLKMIEDEILYDMGKKDAYLYVSKFFETISDEERKFNVSEDALERWHQIHIGYFSERPSEYLDKTLKSGKEFGAISRKSTEKSYEAMVKFRNNDNMKLYVTSQLAEFDRIFSTISEHDRLFVPGS